MVKKIEKKSKQNSAIKPAKKVAKKMAPKAVNFKKLLAILLTTLRRTGRALMTIVRHHTPVLLKRGDDYRKYLHKNYSKFYQFMTAATLQDTKFNIAYEEELIDQIRKPLKIGLMGILVALLIFIFWGSIAPLDKAAVAPGVIIVSSKTKEIQHLEGGIIEKISVKEGDFVEQEQELMVLRDTGARVNQKKVLYQLTLSKALEQRLLIEQKIVATSLNDYIGPLPAWTGPIIRQQIGKDNFNELSKFSDDLDVQKAINTQQEELYNRINSYYNRLGIYDQKLLQYDEQINGLEAQKRSILAQKALSEEERTSVEALFAQGLTNKPRLTSLLRSLEELEGRLGELNSTIARVKEATTEAKLEKINFQNDQIREITEMLRDAQLKSATFEREYEVAEDILERIVIKAPTSGIVTGLRYFTIGAVIGQGQKIMSIVPQDDELIIEAKVMPKDIQSVHVGLKAKVQLSAFKSRIMPRLNGEIIYVSADRVTERGDMSPDGRGGEYFLIRVKIADKELERVNHDVILQAGMPAEVFIVKGTRTLLQYIMGPFLDSFHRAFKET